MCLFAYSVNSEPGLGLDKAGAPEDSVLRPALRKLPV